MTTSPDLVDEHFRPYVAPLGNMVLCFALAEAELHSMITEMLGGDEDAGTSFLRTPDPKKRILALVESIGLTGFDLQELRDGVQGFWSAKERRNRLIHDRWFPNLYEDAVHTRGFARPKSLEPVVYGTPTVQKIWELAVEFQAYDSLFSHRAYVLKRIREPMSYLGQP